MRVLTTLGAIAGITAMMTLLSYLFWKGLLAAIDEVMD